MSIYESLAAVMADVDHVAKRDRNEQQRFIFRGVDAVVNAVGPVLRRHKVIVVPSVESVEYATLTAKSGGALTSCRVVVTYTFYADDGSSIPSKVAAEAFDSGDKATPKAMSVAFRTALLQALALPTDEPDPDAQTYETGAAAAAPKPATRTVKRAPREKPETNGAPPDAPGIGSVTPAQITKIGAAMTALDMKDRTEALAFVSGVVGRDITSRNDLTKDEASRVIDRLERLESAAEDKASAAEGAEPELTGWQS